MDFIRLEVRAMIPADTRRPLDVQAQINLLDNPCQNSGEGIGLETGLYGSFPTLSYHYYSKHYL
jgi:hypothetical protein